MTRLGCYESGVEVDGWVVRVEAGTGETPVVRRGDRFAPLFMGRLPMLREIALGLTILRPQRIIPGFKYEQSHCFTAC